MGLPRRAGNLVSLLAFFRAPRKDGEVCSSESSIWLEEIRLCILTAENTTHAKAIVASPDLSLSLSASPGFFDS